MPCPTCSHTLQGIGQTTDGRRHFWCPRCGTLRSEAGKHADTEAPKVVGYLRSFYRMISDSPEGRALRSLARIEGIEESILTQQERRPDR